MGDSDILKYLDEESSGQFPEIAQTDDMNNHDYLRQGLIRKLPIPLYRELSLWVS